MRGFLLTAFALPKSLRACGLDDSLPAVPNGLGVVSIAPRD
jgi:hypothetical protein